MTEHPSEWTEPGCPNGAGNYRSPFPRAGNRKDTAAPKHHGNRESHKLNAALDAGAPTWLRTPAPCLWHTVVQSQCVKRVILFQPDVFSHKAAPAYPRCNLELNMSDITCCRVFVFITLTFSSLQTLFACHAAGCINLVQSCREEGNMHAGFFPAGTPCVAPHAAQTHKHTILSALCAA